MVTERLKFNFWGSVIRIYRTDARLTDKSLQGDLKRVLVEDFNVQDYGLSYHVPVYYTMGENDYQTPYTLAQELFAQISAPDKAFFTIPDAGHMPMTENNVEFTRVLLEEIRPLVEKQTSSLTKFQYIEAKN